MKNRILLVASFFISVFACQSFAAQTSCPEHFASGQAPDLVNQKLSAKTRDVCYSGVALKHSGITRMSLYSAEHLTRDRTRESKRHQCVPLA